MRHVHRDGAVAEVASEARLPVVLEARREQRVERGVERRVGHLSDVRPDGRGHVEERLDHLLALVDRPAQHGTARHTFLKCHSSGRNGSGGARWKPTKPPKSSGASAMILAVERAARRRPGRPGMQSALRRRRRPGACGTRTSSRRRSCRLRPAAPRTGRRDHVSLAVTTWPSASDDLGGRGGCRRTARTCVRGSRCRRRGSGRRCRSSR